MLKIGIEIIIVSGTNTKVQIKETIKIETKVYSIEFENLLAKEVIMKNEKKIKACDYFLI